MAFSPHPTNILMISRDRTIFDQGSKTRERIAGYGVMFRELHVVVFTHGMHVYKEEQIAPNVWLHPTNAASRVGQMFRAVSVGKKIPYIDIITTQDPFEAGFAGWVLSVRLRAKLHVQVHTDFLDPAFEKESFLNRARVLLAYFTLNRADGIRVVSKRIAESMRRMHLSVTPTILPIFVPVSTIDATPPTFNLHEKYPQFKFIVLMVARLSIEKNISIALSALARAIKTYSHMGLVVVGDGPLLLSLQHEAARLGITDHVVFDGWITNASSLFSYYKTADVFLLTSRHEAFSQALIEAAAAKLPIISTDVGIASEIFTDRTSILLVPQNNDMAIASALTLLLNNNQKRKQLGLDAHEEVMAIFGSEEEYLARLQQSITQCFSESQPHHA